MNLDPAGPAALMKLATGKTPAWAVREKRTTKDDGEAKWIYTPKFLPADAVQHIAALTDPRVGWAIEIRPQNDRLRISARKENA